MSEEEETQEELWYPAFKLKENPFRFFEAMQEMESGIEPFPVIEIEMWCRVESLIKGKISCIVRGERGCGKSVLVSMTSAKQDVFWAMTPRNMDDVYDKIFVHIDSEVKEKTVSKLWAMPQGYPLKCWDPDKEICTECSRHCHIPIKRKMVEEYTFRLSDVDGFCPIKRKIVLTSIYDSVREQAFILDVPDNISKQGLDDLIILSNMIIENLNVLIVFSTPEQTTFLRKTDTFKRLPVIDFQLPDIGFFTRLFKERVDAFREGEGPYPFQDAVIEKLAELSGHVPRTFIQLCNLVLVEMWIQGINEPCGLDIIDKIDLVDVEKTEVSEKDMVVQTLQQYEGKWVKLETLCQDLEANLGRLTERKVSLILKDLGFTLRRIKNGKTEVLIAPYTLREHLEK